MKKKELKAKEFDYYSGCIEKIWKMLVQIIKMQKVQTKLLIALWPDEMDKDILKEILLEENANNRGDRAK